MFCNHTSSTVISPMKNALSKQLRSTLVFCALCVVILACKKNKGDGPDPDPVPPTPPVTETHDTIPSDPETAKTVGFFMDNWIAKTFASPASVTDMPLPGGSATATITVNTGKVITKVAPNFFGNNSNLWIGQLNNEPLVVNHLKDFQPRIIRGPAGSVSDVFFFNHPNGTPIADVPVRLVKADGIKEDKDNYYWSGKNTESWTFSIDGYYDLLQKTNSTGLLTINYGYARYGTSANPVAAAAHLAADWVRYDNGRTKYWEIGNENFGEWEAGYRIDPALNKDGQPEIITGALYGKHFRVFADSMRKAAAEVGATIHISAVVFDSPNGGNTAAAGSWNSGVFSAAGDAPDYYSVHSYFTNYMENSTPDVLFATAANVPGAIKSYLTGGMTSGAVIQKPIAMTEWNLFSSGSKQNVSHIAGVHAVLAMEEMIKNGYGASLRWDLANGWDNGNDHGLFSLGSQKDNSGKEVGEPEVEKWNPRPAFFHMYYFQKCTGDRMLESSVSGSADISSFATSFTSGQKAVVIVNKGASEKTVETKFQYFTPGSKYYYYVLNGGSDNAPFSRMVYVNGKGPSNGIAGGPSTEYQGIKMYATSAADGIKVKVPARSVVFMIVDKKS